MKYKGKEITITKQSSGDYLIETEGGFVLSDNYNEQTLDKLINITKGVENDRR